MPSFRVTRVLKSLFMGLTVLSMSSMSEARSLSPTRVHTMTSASSGTEESEKASPLPDPEMDMDSTELITSKGYPCENHWVTTEDGYILNIHRIPHGRNSSHRGSKGKDPRPVALLQHGFGGSSANFLLNLVNESLANILADSGVDVWMGNSRGNLYSTNHTSLDPKQGKFWEFSLDEKVRDDLPATINYILSVTGAAQLYFIGHSQGTTLGFAAFSENQTLAASVKHFFALGPVARISSMNAPARVTGPLVASLVKRHDPGKWSIDLALLGYVAEHLCADSRAGLCVSILFLSTGTNFDSFNKTRLAVYLTHSYQGTSIRDMLHFTQGIHSKQLQHYDYGTVEENMKHYGQGTPPLYDPRKMKVPVAIFRGGQDLVVDEIDIHWLLPQLRTLTHDFYIPSYEHLDFVFAIDAAGVIYDEILKIIFG